MKLWKEGERERKTLLLTEGTQLGNPSKPLSTYSYKALTRKSIKGGAFMSRYSSEKEG